MDKQQIADEERSLEECNKDLQSARKLISRIDNLDSELIPLLEKQMESILKKRDQQLMLLLRLYNEENRENKLFLHIKSPLNKLLKAISSKKSSRDTI